MIYGTNMPFHIFLAGNYYCIRFIFLYFKLCNGFYFKNNLKGLFMANGICWNWSVYVYMIYIGAFVIRPYPQGCGCFSNKVLRSILIIKFKNYILQKTVNLSSDWIFVLSDTTLKWVLSIYKVCAFVLYKAHSWLFVLLFLFFWGVFE